jgi:hypothetical protein
MCPSWQAGPARLLGLVDMSPAVMVHLHLELLKSSISKLLDLKSYIVKKNYYLTFKL